MKTKSFNFIAAVALFACSAAQAQYIINDNLDGNVSGTVTPGYTFGDVANATHTFQAGVGVGGSIGALVSSDFTAPGVGYGGVAYQYQNGAAVGNTSANLSDYVLSFDALVNKANGGFGVIVQTWALPGFSGAFGESRLASDIGIATAGVFQHFDINLSTMTSGAVMTGGTIQLAWQMDEYMYGGPGLNNQMIIDNVQLLLIPEPSTLALCGLGVLGGVLLRRRKA